MLPIRRKFHSLHQNYFHNYFENDALTKFFNNSNWDSIPSTNVIENNDSYNLEVAVPGLAKNDFKIRIENDTLEVSVLKEVDKEETNEAGKRYIRREFGYTAFHRTFYLPQDVETEKITANLKNGILHLSIPKKGNHAKNNSVIEIEIK